MTNYKDLGIVNTKKMFNSAIKNGFSVPAFNFNNMEQLQGIIEACSEANSPVIIQVSSGALKYIKPIFLKHMTKAAVEYSKELCQSSGVPIALHLDHGNSFELCKFCIDMGFSSVMIDGSSLSYDENIKLTSQVVDYAHKFDVTVEGELGVLAGIEDDVVAEGHVFTRPEEVEDFTKKTGVDSLAIAIGTSHGAYKFKPGSNPKIRIDILKEIEKKIPNFPIVLHGSSSIPQNLIKDINNFGGKIQDAIGIPEEQLKEASKSAVCKINIDSDGRIAMTAAIRKVLYENKGEIDPRKYLGPAKESLKDLYIHKCKEVLCSYGMAKLI